MHIDLIKLQTKADKNGALVALEENRNIPFTIKRVYYIFDTEDGFVRGRHSHKNLQQVLICVKGSCKIRLDDGIGKTEIVLDSPDLGLLVKSNIWREMYDFSIDCVLMVLADQYYNEDDYIRNYQDFLTYVQNQKK